MKSPKPRDPRDRRTSATYRSDLKRSIERLADWKGRKLTRDEVEAARFLLEPFSDR